ncbi:hypothetical protein [Mycoplasma sp. 2634B]|uniref:hypothetical protein n=1 Tax=Mycoplasma sp. 2634B TaxID=3401692 RepID=UPI003AAF1C11
MSVVVACGKENKLNDTDIKLKESKPLSANELKLNEILKTLNSNIQEQDLYLKTQQNIPLAIYTELKSAMIYANISNVKVLEKSPSTLRNQVKNSINSISNMLTTNWYWYLDHLANNSYVFNPFDADYKNLDGQDKKSEEINNASDNNTNLKVENKANLPHSTQELFDYVQAQYGSYSLTLKDAEIIEIKSFPLEQQKNDIYKDKHLNFLVLSNNSFIPYFTYTKIIEKDNKQISKKEILVIPDVFVVLEKDTNSIISAFMQAFKSSYQAVIQEAIDYSILLDEPQDQANTKAYERYKDANLIDLFNENNYSTIFYKTFMKLNESKMQILRYTWGEIDEN